jgi:hypothetical protein
MNLVTLAIRNLRRRMVRSTIVALSVGLAVASALSLVALSNSIEKSTHESADERGADLTVSQRDAPDIFSGFGEIRGVTDPAPCDGSIRRF